MGGGGGTPVDAWQRIRTILRMASAARLASLQGQRERAIDRYADGDIERQELDVELARLERLMARPAKPNWKKLREQVWLRDEGTCLVCKKKIDKEFYDCGHIVDRCAGGKDELENLR